MTYYILANPESGAKKGRLVINTITEYLNEKAIDYRLFETEHAGQESLVIATILKTIAADDRLLIIGGDGTLSLVLNHLPSTIPFGYIPAGSGNDFARSMGISLSPLEALLASLNGKVVNFKAMHYQWQDHKGIAINNIGVGLDASIVHATNKSRLKRLLNLIKLGNLSYLLIAFRVLFFKKSFVARLSEQEAVQIFKQAFLLTLTKHAYFGGGIPLAPVASSLDDWIYLVAVDRLPAWRIISLIPKFIKGHHLDDPRVTFHQYQKLELTIDRTEPVQIDGECFFLSKGDKLQVSLVTRQIWL